MKPKFAPLYLNILLLCMFCFVARSQVNAANCNSNGNGSWDAGGTWSCGTPPDQGDEITIGANTIVTVASNLLYTGNPMKVIVYGVWRFNGGGAKITMPCGSSVVLGFGGQVVGNSSGNSQTIRICSTTYWSATDGAVDGPAAWPEEALPVDLVAFTAKSSDRKVELEWATASEMNASHYSLMRSTDGNNWEQVKTIPAAGQSTSMTTYQASDEVPRSGQWFYLLQQVDIDGTLYEKGVVPVNVIGDRPELQCGPIPVIDGWVEAFWENGEMTSIELVDMLGNKRKPYIIASENGMVRLDVSKMAAGQYLIVALNKAGERRICRILIQ